MCGRITQKSSHLSELETVLNGADASSPAARYNGAPSQDFWVIRRHPETGAYHRDKLIWGLIPHWCKDQTGGRKPINARSETVASLPSFKVAYAKRRCLVPVASFFEWSKTGFAKRPYAIGLKSGAPFALAGIWENWKHPETGELIRTFCILTCPANAFIATIHDRMPVIIPSQAYDRWLSPMEADPRDLLVPYPEAEMTIWSVSTKVNAPGNDDVSILTPQPPDMI